MHRVKSARSCRESCVFHAHHASFAGTRLAFSSGVSCGGALNSSASRDLRIDWLRGLAMTCVIVNHSKLHSVLSWFSYRSEERRVGKECRPEWAWAHEKI